jgi:transcriptional regulator with XRE-family HTH domain
MASFDDQSEFETTAEDISTSSNAVVLDAGEPNFGALLENMRLKHNLSRREVCEKCRITPGMLETLEMGDVSLIDHNRLMVGSIIEQLCNIYDELPDDVLELFNREYDEYHRNDANAEEKFNYSDAGINRRTPRFFSSIIGIIVVLLLLALLGGWGYSTYQRSRQKAASANYDLPSLLPTPTLPMEVMKIPES